MRINLYFIYSFLSFTINRKKSIFNDRNERMKEKSEKRFQILMIVVFYYNNTSLAINDEYNYEMIDICVTKAANRSLSLFI